MVNILQENKAKGNNSDLELSKPNSIRCFKNG